ncbi:MAG: DUF692 domain-containing protein [Nevskiaceae bacterium]|nr:MAG: DUF692 domain-containing protein [Nevskiaceae bacterium]
MAGIGLRDPHLAQIDAERPAIGWIEVHSENFFGDDPRRHRVLNRLRAEYPLSLHGVGLSLGSTRALDQHHLRQLCKLIERYDPWVVSEHCSWGAASDRHSNNLLPMPRTKQALNVLCANIEQVQETLGRVIALENVSTYLDFEPSEFTEAEFLSEIVKRCGCQLLLDLNNIYVNSVNHEFDARAYLAGIPGDAVIEYHLAGHEDRGHTLIDTHGSPVSPAVWSLYSEALQRFGPRPTLIEWDTDIPDLGVLIEERQKAEAMLEGQS